MILAAFVFLLLAFMVSYAWIVLTPVFGAVTENLGDAVETMVTGDALTALNYIVTVFTYIWQWAIVLFLAGFLLWLFLYAHKKEAESYTVPVPG